MSTVREALLDATAIHGAVGYAPHPVQQQIHLAGETHRFRAVTAGRRTGKSTTGGHELTECAFKAYAVRDSLEPKGKRHEYWIVGPEYSDAEKEFRVLYNDCVKLGLPMDRPGTYYDAIGGNMHLSLWNGRFQVHAKSAKYPDTLVGEGLMGVIMAEAAKLKPIVWTKYVRPTLADYAREGSWALFSTTPEGKNWYYDLHQRGQDPLDPNWWSIRMPSWSNVVLFPGGRNDPEILDMEKDMSEEKFKQEVGADFTEFVGRVFKRFNEEDNVGNFEYNPRLPLYIATDYGYTNPNVALFIQVDVWDNVRIIAEYYRRNRTPTEFAEDLDSDPRLGPLSRAATVLFPDPEDPAASATLANKLRLSIAGSTGGFLHTRIDLIRRHLIPQPAELPDEHPDKQPRLKIDRSCKELIREMNDYRYDDDKPESKAGPKENPLKKDDHAPEALGRFYAGYYGQKMAAKVGAKVSKARMRTAVGGRR